VQLAMIGMDVGKNSCSLVGLDAAGKVLLRRRMRRDTVMAFCAKTPACVVAMEACCGAHHMGWPLAAPGHEVRLMSLEYVRPYVKAQKNDDRDAEAIAERRWPDCQPVSWNPPAQNGTRCRPLYEDQDARLSILANGSPEGRIRLCRLFRPDSRSHLPTGRAIRFAPNADPLEGRSGLIHVGGSCAPTWTRSGGDVSFGS